MLQLYVSKLVSRLETLKGRDIPIRLDHAFTALASDIIEEICYDDKEDFLEDPDFAPYQQSKLALRSTMI